MERIITPGQENGPRTVKVRETIDDRGLLTHRSITTLDEVKEEHVYLVYRGATREMVIEADLLGDVAVKNSDGNLPPVVHIECPECTSPEDRRILSITYENKKFELEDIPFDKVCTIYREDGVTPVLGSDGNPVMIEKKLTIKELITCSYCGTPFRITENMMQRAWK